jgi:hypothetical protein
LIFNNISRKTKNSGWSLADFSTRNLVETSESSGPRNIPSSNSVPIDFWKLLISDEMFRDVCLFTNDYAEKWKDAPDHEIHNDSNISPLLETSSKKAEVAFEMESN